jgi:hypothetical protein
MAGKWKTWILEGNEEFIIPPPPEMDSLSDKLEIEKVRYATQRRKREDIDVVRFWHGASGFTKEGSGGNITPAGVWQNILFTELEGQDIDEATYSQAQKILAQSIADSFIQTWKVKYKYWTQRPSMRDPYLVLTVADPPFPGYVSGHSTISATAATVLSNLFPKKEGVFLQNAKDAKNSRLIGGIHYDIDNEIGEYLGKRIGYSIFEKPNPESSYNPEPTWATFSQLVLLKIANVKESIRLDF